MQHEAKSASFPLLQEMEQYVQATQALPSPALLHALQTYNEQHAGEEEPVLAQLKHRFEQLSHRVSAIVNTALAPSVSSGGASREEVGCA